MASCHRWNMNVFYPRIARRHLPLMFAISLIGALIAGGYGILHDQVTYTLSEEYFSKFKSVQFQWADFGWPRRWYVALIGFLATWWVGLIAGWFLSRLTVPHLDRGMAVRQCFAGFGTVFILALAGGLVGAWLGWRRMHDADLGGWTGFVDAYGVKELGRFVWVGFIHNASYAGGLVGLIVALVQARRVRKRAAMVAAS
jgi:hypothetical protein